MKKDSEKGREERGVKKRKAEFRTQRSISVGLWGHSWNWDEALKFMLMPNVR